MSVIEASKYDKSLVTTCPDCGAEMYGLPWEKRDCPVCRVFMMPYYGHPKAPKELRKKYQVMLPHMARAMIKNCNPEELLNKMRSDRIERARK